MVPIGSGESGIVKDITALLVEQSADVGDGMDAEFFARWRIGVGAKCRRLPYPSVARRRFSERAANTGGSGWKEIAAKKAHRRIGHSKDQDTVL